MEYQDIINELYGKLPDYLESQGIRINDQGFFSCIHPDHPDHNPSCSINKGNALQDKVFHCFSGNGHDGNIFTAAHWLEKLPLDGLNFWDTTVKTLCERYDIPFTDIVIDEDTKRKFQAFRGHTDAARVIRTMAFDGVDIKESHVGIKHLTDRGITEESIKEWNIGILTSYKEYTDAIEKLGHTDETFLHTNGLLNKNIFNRDGFIIPIDNIKNQTVGFVSRNCRHAPNEHVNQKYINSPGTNIYTKGEILFGYNKAIKESGPLYIVEGYLDAIVLRQEGLKKVAAIGATILTEYHVDLLFSNETDVILCLDGDKGGEDGTRIAIERLAQYSRFNLKIIDLPVNSDPDSYVREFGLPAFKALEKITPFAWSLKHSSYSDDMTAVAQKIIPTIAAETSSISRLRMIKELAQFTAIGEIDIKGDVDALVNKEDDKYVQELRDINQYVQMQLSRRRISDTKSIIREAYGKIDILSEKFNASKNLQMEHYNKLQSLEEKIKNGDYKYGLEAPNFRSLEKALDGIPYWANLGLFAGRPSAGKCLGKDTPIIMYDGTIKMVQDVEIGDQLMGPDSTSRTVLSLARGKEEMFLIQQNKADDYIVNRSHILSLKRSKIEGVHNHGDIVNISIDDYVAKPQGWKDRYKGYKVGISFDDQSTNIDPYYLGLWLGDGKSTDTRIYNTDNEIIDYIHNYAANEHLRCSEGDINRSCHSFAIVGDNGNMKKRFLDYDLINNKHVPHVYIANNREIRLKLLAGIIDSDGSYAKHNYYELTLKNRRLFDDVKYLCNTLGLRTSVGKVKHVYDSKGEENTYYRMTISGNINEVPVLLERKKAIAQTTNRDHTMTGITVDSIGPGDYYGFTLDGDHLFLLGDCTVTHNTAFLTALSLDVIEANPDAAIFYMSIDDNADLLQTKMLAVKSGLTTSQIKQYSELNEDKQARIDEAMGFLKSISNRYIIADSTQGNSVDVLENHVKWFCKEFPDSKKIFLLDNFHKLQMEVKGNKQKNDAIQETSSRIKDIADLNDICIMSTVELRKLQREDARPTRQDMQGSNRLDYDANFVGLIHNDMQVNPDTRIRHSMPDANGDNKFMPFIEVNLAKNKINGKTGVFPYKYNSENMIFEQCKYHDWNNLRKRNPTNEIMC